MCILRVLLNTQQRFILSVFRHQKRSIFKPQITRFTSNSKQKFTFKNNCPIGLNKKEEVLIKSRTMSSSIEEENLILDVSELLESESLIAISETKSSETEKKKISKNKNFRNKIKAKKKIKSEQVDDESEEKRDDKISESENEKVEKKKQSKPKKMSPNWFVALQILNAEILQKFSDVQVLKIFFISILMGKNKGEIYFFLYLTFFVTILTFVFFDLTPQGFKSSELFYTVRTIWNSCLQIKILYSFNLLTKGQDSKVPASLIFLNYKLNK